MTGDDSRRSHARLLAPAVVAVAALAVAAAVLRPTATADPSPSEGAPTGVVAADPGLAPEPWWGGPTYYARFPKAAASGWTSPGFFPIAVFIGRPSHAAALRTAGINTYMAAEHDGSAISTITRTGISVIAQDEWTAEEIGDDSRVVGWFVSDECEMGVGVCADAADEAGRLTQQQTLVDARRALDDGRFLQANFGNGVLGTYWAPTTMGAHVALMDVTSVDKYAYTSPHVQSLLLANPFWPTGRDPAASVAYGWLQDRMQTYDATKPNWVFVETAMPYLSDDGARTIDAEQIEGAVWNALIHGAAGIAYFQHNNNGLCGNYSIIECGAARTAQIRSINARVTAMAPVLNSPSYAWRFGSGAQTALKIVEGYAYILAMTDGGTGSRSFTLPPALAGATSVQVVDEDRSIAVTDGAFTDEFAAEHTHHIYRIPLR
ncbi:hypothetical protein [Microbacterium aurum]